MYLIAHNLLKSRNVFVSYLYQGSGDDSFSLQLLISDPDSIPFHQLGQFVNPLIEIEVIDKDTKGRRC